MELLTANQSGRYRTEVMNGRTYFILPVRMIVPGVLTGNRGSLLYREKEIAESVHAWNNVPIVVNHPKRNGTFISARAPEVIAKTGVGYVFNAHQKNGNLDGEAWIDIEKLDSVDSDMAARVRRGERMEVSTGLGTYNVEEHGTYNGKQYTHVAKNHAPDHLALLTSETGACSLKDGCGLAVNSMKQLVEDYEASGTSLTFSQWQTVNSMCKCNGKCNKCRKEARVNLSFQPTTNSRQVFTFQPTINADDSGGIWRTTEDGRRIYIKDGQAFAGGPNGKALGKGGSASKSKSSKSDSELMKLYRQDRALGGEASFKEWKKAYLSENKDYSGKKEKKGFQDSVNPGSAEKSLKNIIKATLSNTDIELKDDADFSKVPKKILSLMEDINPSDMEVLLNGTADEVENLVAEQPYLKPLNNYLGKVVEGSTSLTKEESFETPAYTKQSKSEKIAGLKEGIATSKSNLKNAIAKGDKQRIKEWEKDVASMEKQLSGLQSSSKSSSEKEKIGKEIVAGFMSTLDVKEKQSAVASWEKGVENDRKQLEFWKGQKNDRVIKTAQARLEKSEARLAQAKKNLAESMEKNKTHLQGDSSKSSGKFQFRSDSDPKWDSALKKSDERAIKEAKSIVKGFKPLGVGGDSVGEPRLGGVTKSSVQDVHSQLKQQGFKMMQPKDSSSPGRSFKNSKTGQEVYVTEKVPDHLKSYFGNRSDEPGVKVFYSPTYSNEV